MSGGDGVYEIMNIDGTLNVMFDEYDTYFEFISKVRFKWHRNERVRGDCK